MKKSVENYVVLIYIVFSGILFHYQYLNEFPSHIHAWAQSDRYAISLGFIDNNFDFFHPQTFIKNHQFPNNWQVPAETSITAVDFPVNEYVAAIIMKITGSESPFIYRLIVLLWSFLGLFYLFKIARLLTGSFLKSLLVIVLASSAPVFIYYQSALMVSVPALSSSIIGVYLYGCYVNRNKSKYFVHSLLFLMLATLMRTTFIIELIAIVAIEFLRFLAGNSRITWKKGIGVCLSFGVIIGYYLYNQLLTEKYGSIYLNHLLPAESIEEALLLLSAIWENWKLEYYSLIHYIVLFSLFLVVLFKKASSLFILKSNEKRWSVNFLLLT